MKKSTLVTQIALVAAASLTLAMNAQARSGGGMGGGMGGFMGGGMASAQGYKQMGGQNKGQQLGDLTRTRSRNSTQQDAQQETRTMTQERVRQLDGNGVMNQRQETRMERNQTNRQDAVEDVTLQ